eukprot:scaffold125936_cov17-Tisochrysis_lutea.AAC.1
MYSTVLGFVKCVLEDIFALWGEHPLSEQKLWTQFIRPREHKVPQLQYREYFEETPIGNVNRRAAHQQGARKGK